MREPAAARGPLLPRGQVTTTRADGSVLVSCGRELHEGARGAVALLPERFRLDVAAMGDSLRIVVRPLCQGRLSTRGSGYGGPVLAGGSLIESAALTVGRHDLGFVIGEAGDGMDVEVAIATAREPARGIVRVSCQAIARPL